MGDNTSKVDRMNSRFPTVTRYFRKYRLYLIAGGFSVICSNGLILATPYITKLVFDTLEEGGSSSEVLKYVAIAFALAIGSGIFRFMMRRTIIWMSRHIEYDLRDDIFAHLLKLNPSFFHNTRTGDLMARMTNDLEAVRQMIGPGVMYISDTIIKLTVSFAVMIYLSPLLTLYAALPLVILPFAVNKIGNLIHVRSMKVQEKFSELTAAAQENLSGMRVIKAYRQEEAEVEGYSHLSRDYIGLNMSLATLQAIFVPSMRLLASASYIVVLYVGGRSVIGGGLGLGDVVAFFGYLSMILWPMIAIGWVTSLYQRGTASLDRINKVLHMIPTVKDDGEELHTGKMHGKIEYRDLHFAFNGNEILDGIDLTIESGQTIGLVGRTGSGKTTLVSLLARQHPVERGQVFIDDIDINNWQLDSLRRQIGFATQEPFLFSDTIEENIRFHRRSATCEHIVNAAETAALSKDIATFTDGYETMVGERGITLSGGQKQRTTIARALVHDPAILVLDDAASSVDTETEDEIRERIKTVLDDRTAIIISHRVSSVKNADKIIYLHDGRIAEEGTHNELMGLNGRYADLYHSQLLEMELESL